MGKKLLYLIPQNPYPATDGGKIGLYYPIKYLKDYFELIVFFRANDYDSGKLTQNHFKSMNIKSDFFVKDIKDKKINILKNLIESVPFKWSKYYDKKILSKLHSIIFKENIKYLLVSHPHVFIYAIQLKKFFPEIKVVFREHNIEADLYSQYIKLSKNPIHKLIALWQYKKALHSEKKFWRISDKICFISDSDYKTALKEEKGILNKSYVVYDGFETKGDVELIKERETKNIVFSGKLDILQNSFNMNWFIKTVWEPFVSSGEGKDYRLYITGNSIEKVEKFLKINRTELEKLNIIPLGFIENLDEFLEKQSYFVSPTIIGSGIRLKVLHAMASGMITLLTKLDYETVKDFKDMENVVLFRNYEEFSSKIKKLQESDKLRNYISYNAYNLIKNKLNWDNYAKKMSEIILSL